MRMKQWEKKVQFSFRLLLLSYKDNSHLATRNNFEFSHLRRKNILNWNEGDSFLLLKDSYVFIILDRRVLLQYFTAEFKAKFFVA